MTSLFETVARDFDVTQSVDQALMRFCRHLSNVLPIEGAFVGKHLVDRQQVMYVARADLSNSWLMEEDAISVCDTVQDYLVSKDRPESCAYQIKKFPSMRELNRSLVPADRSFMEIRLRAGETPIGMIGMYARARQTFGDGDTQLMLDVRQPFAQTLAIHLMKSGLFTLPWAQSQPQPQPQSRLDVVVSGADEKNSGMVATSSPLMRKVMQQVDKVAPLPHTVLLLGETGVGKEVLARRLHERSMRRDGPFIHVNCGALPEQLVDSELFGHERGAFTGADHQHVGFFEQADGGTIFLDEIGELPMAAQARLLLTLQDKTINRVGGRQRIPLDFRVVAATNRNLDEMTLAQSFRRDLLYRLNALTIAVPPLRERREDIPALAEYFIRKTARYLGMAESPRLPDDVLRHRAGYGWPGNVRELSNRIEQALIFGDAGLCSMTLHTASVRSLLTDRAVHEEDGAASLQRYTRIHIQQILDQTQGRVAGPGGAAEILQVHPSTLRSRMKKLNIVYGRRYPLHYRLRG